MPNIVNPEFPDLFLEHGIGNPWAKSSNSMAKLALRVLTDPNCPGGTHVDYRRVRIRMADRTWRRLKGADDAPGLLLRRSWRHAAVLAMEGVAELESIYGPDNVRHGVVRMTRSGEAEAGLLPEGVRLGTYFPYGEDEAVGEPPLGTLMYRTGPTTLTEAAAPALYVPERGKLYVPIKAQVLQEHIPIAELTAWTQTYNTPVV